MAGGAGCAAQPIEGLRQGCDSLQNRSASDASGLLPMEQAWGDTCQLQPKWGSHHGLPEGSGLEAQLHACLDQHGHQSGAVLLLVLSLRS